MQIKDKVEKKAMRRGCRKADKKRGRRPGLPVSCPDPVYDGAEGALAAQQVSVVPATYKIKIIWNHLE